MRSPSDVSRSIIGRVTRATTRIEVCGRLEIEIEGERLDRALSGRQGRLLFAYLLLNRDRPVRRDELLDVLFETDGARSHTDSALRPPLSRLRKALGEGRLEGRSELALVLPADATIDWEDAHRALDVARTAARAGDWARASREAGAAAAIAERGLLPGLEASWIDERRRELTELRVEALETVATAGAAIGGAELPAAERAARAAIEAAPFRESAYAALMRILRAGGNVAEAMRVFERLRLVLREELGTTPGPRLIALHDELLRAEEAEPEQAPAGVRMPAYTAQLRAIAAPARTGTIFERETELSAIDAVLDAAAGGQGRVVLVEGPAGIGKSRLLAEVRALAAERGLRPLAGRASELERDFPFGVARQLFEAVLADPAQREQALAGAAGPAERVFSAAGAPSGGEFAALHGLFWLAANLSAAGPLLLAVDDLHWCDAASLRFVAYLAQRLEGLPIVVVATIRTGDPATEGPLIAEISQDPAALALRPAPLSREAVDELVRERLGEGCEPGFCAACHRATVGNPLLLRQLLTALESDGIEPTAENAALVREIGPGAVSRSVVLRLSKLGDDARSVARAVAVLGEHSGIPTIAALAGLNEERVAAVAGALERAEILGGGAPLGFAHPLVRDAVYHDLALGERELWHARAARLLSDAGAARAQVASHLLPAPHRGDPWVVDCLIEAGREAVRKGAPDSAVAYLERALAEPPNEERRTLVLYELGMAEGLTRGPASAQHLRAAYDRLTDPVERAKLAETLGRTLLFTGEAEAGAALARRARAELGDRDDELSRRLEALELVAVLFGAGDADDLRRLEPYRTPQPGASLGTKMLMSLAALHWSYSGGPADDCAALALSALEGRELIAADNALMSVSAIFTLSLADVEEAADIWEEAVAEAHRRGSLFSMASINLWRGATGFYRGELIEAEQMLRTALDQIRSWGFSAPADVYAHAFMAATLHARGDLAGAWEHIDAVTDTGARSDAIRWWLVCKADLLMAEGRYDAAMLVAEEIGMRFPWVRHPMASPWANIHAFALAQLGERDEAIAELHSMLDLARSLGTASAIGTALRIVASVEPDRAIEYLQESVTLLERSPNRLQHAKSLHKLGEALRLEGRYDEARIPLRQALELAEASGARRLAAFARGDLARCGEERALEDPTGAALLTPSERRVAELAAVGASDFEIAQTLFVAPKAVAGVLSAAYRKLGVSGRTELGRALQMS